MNLSFTEEQEMIRDSVRDYFSGAYNFDTHLARIRGRPDIDRACWRQMAELGWLGLGVPSELGGLGAGAEEAMLLMEGCGAALCAEPVRATAVLAAPLLGELGDDASPLARRVLEQAVAGEVSVSLAWTESPRGFVPLNVATKAGVDGAGGFHLSGQKVLVDGGGAAEWLIVPARVSGAEGDLDGISLFLVAGAAPGLTRVSATLLDGSHVADLFLDQVSVAGEALLGVSGQGGPALRAAAYRGMAATCAEAAGAIGKALQICREYLHQRHQFGKPLAAFQALQHRYVDLMMAEERSRSMATLAAIRVQERNFDVGDSMRDLHLAKMIIGRSARLVGAQGIQLHGGMGMAQEYPIGHYYRKLLCCDAAFGTADDHQALLASAGWNSPVRVN